MLTRLDRAEAGVGVTVGLGALELASYERDPTPEGFAEVEALLRRALSRAPLEGHALAGLVLLHSGRRAGALAAGPDSLARQLCSEHAERSRDAALAASCAAVFFAEAQPDRGRALYRRATEARPGYHAAWLTWGDDELAAGNHAIAARRYQSAADSPYPSMRYAALLGLGVTRERAGDRAGAERAYREASESLSTESTPPPPHEWPEELLYNLGALLSESDDWARRAKGFALLDAYLQLVPGLDDARVLRARQLTVEFQRGCEVASDQTGAHLCARVGASPAPPADAP